MDQPTPPEPGWYPDAADPARERWWDGSEWSPVTRPSPSDAGSGGYMPPPGPNPYASPGANPYAAPGANPYAVPTSERTPPEGSDVPPPETWGALPPEPPHGGSPTGGPPTGGPPTGGPHDRYHVVRSQPAAGPATPDGVPLASPLLRLIARVLDALIITVLTAAAGGYYLARMLKMGWPVFDAAIKARQSTVDLEPVFTDPVFVELALRYSFVQLLVGGVYSVIFTHLLGGTLGKLMVGIRVRSWDEPGRPTWGQALARWLTREVISQVPFGGIGTIYLLADSVWLLWDPKRQCLHDKLPATVVVQHR